MTKTYIIILNYNGWRDTQECLESVLKLDYPNCQIIVVDNNSPNDSMSHLLAWAKGEEEATVDNSELAHLSKPHYPKPLPFVFYDKQTALNGGLPEKEAELSNPIIFIQAGENRGFAAGNNVGTEYALKKGDADYIWYLNNDTVVEPNALTEYMNKASGYKKKNEKVGIIGAKLMYYYQPTLIQAIGGTYNKWFATTKHIGAFERDLGQYDNEGIVEKISYPVGASMFVDVNFINDLGLMCEDYFLYFEEPDWVYRGNKLNWQVGYCWKTRVFHKEGGSIGSGNKNKRNSDVSDYYGVRNRLLFTKKFNYFFYLSVWFSLFFVMVNRIIRKDLNKFINVFKIVFWFKNAKI